MHELFKYVVRVKWREVGEGKCMCSCKRSRTARSSMKMGWDHMVSEASAERFVFRARAGPLCPAESSKMQLCGCRKKAEKADWDGVCSGVWCVRNKTSYIPWTMRAKASFLHDNQVPHPKYQCFCAVISARLRKARANEVPLCFRCAASLRTHPHMYLQRSGTSRIHWQLHVKCAVSCPPYTVQPWRKSLRKSFVMHLFERSTVWCSLLVLKMSSSAAAHAHKSWPSWLWRHNPSPPPHFSGPLRRLFVVPTLGGHFLRTR